MKQIIALCLSYEAGTIPCLYYLGSRLQKYWYKLQTRETGKSLQITVSSLSKYDIVELIVVWYM